ncbi:MAG: gamma-glutamyltransferase [Alphaproteobacteria bacterium]|nr:gamma-glutamyltransferase [Alphaproteobacteria bacterium]
MRDLVRVSMAISCSAILAGCGAEPFEVQEGFFGGVAADEPRAALVMRDVLVEGGRAADAAVAGYFALSVTLPSSAGLGASGSCVVFDPSSQRFEHLDFPAKVSSGQGPAIALPLAPRAMFALHARYGRLRFEALVTEAERLARFGEPVSARLAADLAWANPKILGKPEVAGVLGGERGGVVARGEVLVQNALGATLGRLRNAGVGDLYVGPLARQYVEAVRAAGYRIEPDRLRDALPAWSAVTSFEHDNHIWGVAGADAVASGRAASILSSLFARGGWPSDDLGQQATLLNQVARNAGPRVGAGSRPDIPGATSFMAVDRAGQAVACAVGMAVPFGLGDTAAGTGIFLRPAADNGPAAALAVIAGNKNTWQFHLGATAGGGEAAFSTLGQSVLAHYEDDQSVARAVEAPRTHPDPANGVLYVEQAAAGAGGALSGLGMTVKAAPLLGRAALFRCVGGLSKDSSNCDLAGDRRGGGLVLFEREQ